MERSQKPVALMIAPLVGFVGSSLPDERYELINGVFLRRNRKMPLGRHIEETTGRNGLERVHMAAWRLEGQYEPGSEDREGKVQERIKRALLSMWLARPTGASIQAFVAYPEQETNTSHVSTPDAWVIPHDGYKYDDFTVDDVAVARHLNASIETVHTGNQPLWRTLHLLFGAMEMWYWEARFVMFTIVLESLFTKDSQEVSYKIAQRYAWFNHSATEDRKTAFQRMRDIYSARSKIVHGANLKSLAKGDSAVLLLDLERACQRTLQKLLLDPDVLQRFSEEKDVFLTNLLFE